MLRSRAERLTDATEVNHSLGTRPALAGTGIHRRETQRYSARGTHCVAW